MIILLCTIANVCLLGGSIQAFRAARKQANRASDKAAKAETHSGNADDYACEAAEHATKAEEQASNASKHASIADQHAQTVGQISLLMKSEPNIRLVDTIQPNISNTGGNIGKRR